MVSTHPLISKFSSTFNNCDCNKSTDYNWYKPHLHVPQFFFHNLANSRYLSLFSFCFSFTLWLTGTATLTNLQVLFFFLIIIRSYRLAENKSSVCMLKSHRSLCVSFSWTNARLSMYHLFRWSNLNFLHNSLWITLPTHLCLVLYSFYCTLVFLLIFSHR